MEIINLFDKKCISYGNSLLCADTEENVIKFYNECVENDEKYKHDINHIKWENSMAFYQRRS